MINELVKSNTPSADMRVSLYCTQSERYKPISKLHYHDEIELLTILNGALCVRINDTDYTVESGDTFFCSSRIPHETYVLGKCDYILLQFRPERFLGDSNNVGKYLNRFIRSSAVPFKTLSDKDLYEYVQRLLLEKNREDKAYEIMLKGMLYSIIALLCRLGVIADENISYSQNMVRLLPAIKYIDEHYQEELSLDEVAASVGFNRSYFCRLFKRVCGSSFTDYLGFVRVCKSEKMLAEGDASILDIAYDVGFSSVSYFNRIFKKHKNCTPTDYRRARKGSYQAEVDA